MVKLRRDDVLAQLREAMPELKSRYDVAELSVIGSVSRDEAHDGSDLDVLVRFQNPATLTGYMALSRHLEQLFGVPVDVATPAGLRPAVRDWIEREAIHVS
jgi:uncharacterized protein